MGVKLYLLCTLFLGMSMTTAFGQIILYQMPKDSVLLLLSNTKIVERHGKTPEKDTLSSYGATIAGYAGTYNILFDSNNRVNYFHWRYSHQDTSTRDVRFKIFEIAQGLESVLGNFPPFYHRCDYINCANALQWKLKTNRRYELSFYEHMTENGGRGYPLEISFDLTRKDFGVYR